MIAQDSLMLSYDSVHFMSVFVYKGCRAGVESCDGSRGNIFARRLRMI